MANLPEWMKAPTLPTWWKRKDMQAERAFVGAQTHPVLIAVAAVLPVAAITTEAGFMALFVLRSVGDIDWKIDWAIGSAGFPHVAEWHFATTIHPILFVLLFAASVVITCFSALWLPIAMALRGAGRWIRVTCVVVGLFCNGIVIGGGVVSQHENRETDLRDDAIIQQQAQAGKAAIQARIDAIDERLATMRDRTKNNEYAATAANVGETAYRENYMSAEALARSPEARRDIIVRALGAAIAADKLEAERVKLVAQMAAAPVAAQVKGAVEDKDGAGLAALSTAIEVWRPVTIALGLAAIGIMGTWWVIGMTRARALFTTPEPAPVKEEAAPAPAALAPVPDEGELPLLADWTEAPDERFQQLHTTVDGEGRKQKRVGGHWRLDEKAAPKAKADKRRAPEPAESEPVQEPEPAFEAGEGSEGIDDLVESVLRSVPQSAEEDA